MNALSILLVEDDELDVISFERALKKINLPITLFTAYNGVEALHLLNGKNKIPIPDLIVLDVNMPKMNGVEFLAELRKDQSFNDVKIYMMTTSNEDRDRKKGEEFGVAGYIIKPLNFTENTKRNDSMDNFMHFQIMKMVGDRIT